MKPRKKKAKELVLPHSQAKLDLYQTYLGKFLTILSLAQFTTAVNIYDIFCGTGIYKDEKFGSPILAYNSIVRTKRLFNSRNWKLKPLKLIINDGEAEKVDKVRNYLERMTKVCNFEFHNKDSEEIIGILKKQIAKQSSTIRNLILIDPYGYKEIHKGDIDSLMRKKNTEILLFLPVAQMYRFSTVAQKENTTNTGYIRLKEFIEDFFHETHAIRNNQITDIFHYISEIESALTLGKYYSSSYYIQRDKSNYYALFFLTPNLFGLEKILGAK
ncbi:MAG: three-Cys-motif partner protein TcmP, partial [Ekhidna sp.]